MNRLSTASYPIPAQSLELEYEVKKSRFIARVGLARNREEAMAMLAQAKIDYPDARHHCWAYLLGNAHSAAMSDDGEPSGTAGKPILNVLQHKGVGDVMLVVTRYFGGIKLGAGGLVRAYSAAAQQVMEALPTHSRVLTEQRRIRAGFATEQMVRHWLGLHEGEVNHAEYGECVEMLIELPQTRLDDWDAFAAAQGIESQKP